MYEKINFYKKLKDSIFPIHLGPINDKKSIV